MSCGYSELLLTCVKKNYVVPRDECLAMRLAVATIWTCLVMRLSVTTIWTCLVMRLSVTTIWTCLVMRLSVTTIWTCLVMRLAVATIWTCLVMRLAVATIWNTGFFTCSLCDQYLSDFAWWYWWPLFCPVFMVLAWFQYYWVVWRLNTNVCLINSGAIESRFCVVVTYIDKSINKLLIVTFGICLIGIKWHVCWAM